MVIVIKNKKQILPQNITIKTKIPTGLFGFIKSNAQYSGPPNHQPNLHQTTNMNHSSKLSACQLKKSSNAFCVDIDATKTALLLEFNRNTINRRFAIFRQEIYEHQTNQKP